MVCAAKGYKLILTMPEDMSEERRMMLTAYGAEVILTPKELQMQGSIDKAKEIIDKTENSYSPKQFENDNNPEIHKKTTAIEIIEQMNGDIDAFVAGVGTGGTISGVGEVLKEKIGNIKIIAVEPDECPTLTNGMANPHLIQGIGAGFVPETLNQAAYDEILKIKGQNAIEMTKKLSKDHGIFVGISAGANVLASIEIAKKLPPNSRVVTILCDTGERYLSTGIFN